MRVPSKSISAALLIICAGSFVSVNTQAEEVSPRGPAMKGIRPAFSDFDLDGDGKIVETEFNQGHVKRMSEMEAEGRPMKRVADAPGFSDVDADGNGSISEQEFAAHQEPVRE
jgi:Ca2+-binding EF-hand superfamily protein